MSFDLVIFDCDGVLVDSEPIANRVDTEQLNSIGLNLTSAEIMQHFVGRLFSAEEVSHPKPAPDLFLHAAKRMGALPERCVVVEDTPTGARAGTAAGMTVFGYAGNAHSNIAALEAEGAIVFRSMAELPSLLGAMA